MNRKIGLNFDGKLYNVCVNEEIIYSNEKREEAYKIFEKTVDNNKQGIELTWEDIKESVEKEGVDDVSIHEAYQAIEYRNIKYFHQTGKLFYTGKGEMLPLAGGHRLLQFILEQIASKQLEDSEALIELFVQATHEEINYYAKDSIVTFRSAIFNYGSVSYHFQMKEMHKGTSIEKVSFEDFRSYVVKTIA